MAEFLPVSREDMEERGINQLDFICVTGDAYVDHPSFGVAIISRVLEFHGHRVGIIAQPDWKDTRDFMKLGRPKYGFLVTSGNIDSMVAHYTVAKKLRTDDFYSPGGKAGKRPDRAVIVYCNRIREAYGDIPIVIGGLEASLRRFAHYDYWDDRVRRSILFDAQADLLTYGMGEKQTEEIARRLASGEPVSALTNIRGTCYAAKGTELPFGAVECAPFEQVRDNKTAYAKACRKQMDEQDALTGRTVIQRHGDRYIVQNPPMQPLSQSELDRVYSLPYMRYYHPMYDGQGGVPAIEEVEFSIAHNRGCFGNCNFCSIAFHQGRVITCRSEKSVLAEAEKITRSPRFKGYIHDVGGPTANFRLPSCQKQLSKGLCRGKKCLAPKPCANLQVDHTEYLDLLRKVRAVEGVKRVFVRSGLRYDYMLEDKDETFMRELIAHHVSGQLKVAPEHCSAVVLDRMGKPHIEAYIRFARKFYGITKEAGKEQYLVPYLMSSHPGSTMKEAVELALFLKRENIRPEQVQDFYPTPGTVSTCMFYTGLDPYTMQPVYVPKDRHEKAMQRALLQYFRPKNRALVIEALRTAGRADLIGFGEGCLVRPDAAYQKQQAAKAGGRAGGRPGQKRTGKHSGVKNGKGRAAWQKGAGRKG